MTHEELLTDLWERNRTKVRGVIANRLMTSRDGGKEEIDELEQHAICGAWKLVHIFEAADNPDALFVATMLKIARNKAIDNQRGRYRHGGIPISLLGASGQDHEMQTIWRRSMDHTAFDLSGGQLLSNQDRWETRLLAKDAIERVLPHVKPKHLPYVALALLSTGHGIPQAEIAARFNLTVNSVKSRVWFGIRILRMAAIAAGFDGVPETDMVRVFSRRKTTTQAVEGRRASDARWRERNRETRNAKNRERLATMTAEQREAKRARDRARYRRDKEIRALPTVEARLAALG